MPRKAVQWVKPTPWESEVLGHELAADILADVQRFMRMSEPEAYALTLWIMFAHAHDAFENSPFLAVSSPVPGCGKSRTGRIIEAHVPCAMNSSRLSRAVLYRATQDDGPKPTMLLDEVETYLFTNPEMVGILNAGHSRSSAKVHLTAGEDFHVVEFDLWLPKMLMFIGTAPPTIADRSIPIALTRLRSDQTVERIPFDYEAQCEERRRKLARWAFDNFEKLSNSQPVIPGSLHNRARDNWRPLLAIADLLGEQWGTRSRDAAIVLSGGASLDIRERVLADVRNIFAEENLTFVPSRELVRLLLEIPDAPWSSLRQERGLDEQTLAKLLEGFGIRPKKVNRANARNQRGYDLADCREAFATYLPNDPSAEAA